MSPLLADLILVVHFLFVAFVVGGLALVWAGAPCGWRWVRNWWFRAAHLAAILFVAIEAPGGIMCPLTVWEDTLRGRSGETGFIERWLHGLLFYDCPGWVFAAAYVLFAAIVAATWIWVRPLPRRRAQLRRPA
jgi:hypothetical protein